MKHPHPIRGYQEGQQCPSDRHPESPGCLSHWGRGGCNFFTRNACPRAEEILTQEDNAGTRLNAYEYFSQETQLDREQGFSIRFPIRQWGKQSKFLLGQSLPWLWKHKCVSGVSRQTRLGWQEKPGIWNEKNEHVFRWRCSSSRHFV